MPIYDALTDLQGAMKYVYEEDMSLLDYTDDDFLKALKKETDFVGKYHVLGVDYGGGRAGSDPTKVFGQSSVRKEYQFLVAPVAGYAVANVSGMAIQVGRGDGSLIDVVKLEVDRALIKSKEQLLQNLFGNGGGAIGRLTATQVLTGATFTLATPADVINFRVGDRISFSAADGTTGAIRAGSVGYYTVTARNSATGVITVDSNLNEGTLIVGISVSDYVFHWGDFGKGMLGVRAWIPTTDPTTGDAVFGTGVDRSVDPQLLAGLRLTPSATRLDEQIAEYMAFAQREQVHPDYCIMNPDYMGDLQKLEGALVRANLPLGEAQLGFSSMCINSTRGPLPIESSSYCPKGAIWFLTMEDWALKTTMKAPSILDQDTMWLRITNDDAYELRVGWYGSMICREPHRSGCLVLA